jgi:ubiquinone/menaquinone biosynthesis C-methylase UbiE
MDKDLKNEQKQHDRAWRRALAAGREDFGNLQTNLEFLGETGLLQPNDKILEIGCGIGSIVFKLSMREYNITGVDISREAIAHGLKKYGNIKLQVQAAEALPYEKESFDVVLSFDLFEHIAQVDKHVSEVSRVLRTGGYYLFQTPNKYSNIIWETLKSRSLRWRQYHPSLHSPGQLRRRLYKHGFGVRFVKMNPINEFTIKKLRKIGPIGHIFRLIFEHIDFRCLPLIFQTNLYVIARKVKS